MIEILVIAIICIVIFNYTIHATCELLDNLAEIANNAKDDKKEGKKEK